MLMNSKTNNPFDIISACINNFNYRIENRLITQVWHGDSHIISHLPSEFEAIRKTKPGGMQRFESNIVNRGIEGRLLDENFVLEVCQDIRELQQEPTLHLLCISNYNLRQRPTMSEVDNIVTMHQQIADVIANTRQAALMIVSPIDCKDPFLRRILEDLDTKLWMMCQKFKGHVWYVSFSFSHNRQPKTLETGQRFNPTLYSDDFHLNREGAKLLAWEIFEAQRNIPNERFGRPNSKAVQLKRSYP